MRRHGATGTVLLGAGLLIAAGLFDGEALYVPAIVLLVLGLIAGVWVRLASRGVRVERRLAATRVQEDEPLLVELDVIGGRVAPPAGEVHDPLLRSPARLAAGRRRSRVRIRARFSRRGRRTLAPPAVLVRDPLGLSERLVPGTGPQDEVLVLPRVEPVLEAPAAGARGARGLRRTARRGGAAEVDLAGLRAHRPGTPASRIAWPLYSRTGELHERVLQDDGDQRPVVVLDLRGATEADADAAARAAASLTVHLAERGGCALLAPGDRRPALIEPGLRAWPHAHARLALARTGEGPALGALAGRRGLLVWVSARPRNEPPRGLGAGARVLVVPGRLAGRPAAFTVAGCTGYAAVAPRPAASLAGSPT
ncbi:MAG: DUF58 domain-containing protein [Solirubrobacteraceae bacterium]|nr:DUF58 domain-containing protein [Solirubrobacteraceae bacterium]